MFPLTGLGSFIYLKFLKSRKKCMNYYYYFFFQHWYAYFILFC
uniref:Uncharacterized protein n=1 Tax=Anguilla anguilla TaxID=7936 RepID=A0A0E9S5I3_ANGAN